MQVNIPYIDPMGIQIFRFTGRDVTCAEELHDDYEKQCSMPVSPASRRDVLIKTNVVRCDHEGPSEAMINVIT